MLHIVHSILNTKNIVSHMKYKKRAQELVLEYIAVLCNLSLFLGNTCVDTKWEKLIHNLFGIVIFKFNCFWWLSITCNFINKSITFYNPSFKSYIDFKNSTAPEVVPMIIHLVSNLCFLLGLISGALYFFCKLGYVQLYSHNMSYFRCYAFFGWRTSCNCS